MKFILDLQLFASKKGAGSILYRQRGTKMHAGTNVKMGGDDTLFTTVSGIVKFERVGRSGKKVSVYPVEAAN